MNILLLGDNQICQQAATILRQHGATITGVILNDAPRAKDSILQAAGNPPIFTARDIEDGNGPDAELAISVHFGHILRPAFLDRIRTVNLHPAMLPWNRGAFPNVWSIIDGTPAGVTLHEVDEGVDTGAILAQREVPVHSWDTGQSLHARLLEAEATLLDETADDLLAGRLSPQPQEGDGTTHRTRDVKTIDQINLDATMRVGDLINILRARTFPPHKGAFIEEGDQRIYLQLHMEPECTSSQK